MTITMTLKEVMDTCEDWKDFCEKKGFSVYVVNEGGGDIQIHMDVQEAHRFGIVNLPDWKAEKPSVGFWDEEEFSS